MATRRCRRSLSPHCSRWPTNGADKIPEPLVPLVRLAHLCKATQADCWKAVEELAQRGLVQAFASSHGPKGARITSAGQRAANALEVVASAGFVAEFATGLDDVGLAVGRVGGRRGGVQGSLGGVRRFQLRARVGAPSLRLRPPPRRTGQADFRHPAHREGVIHRGYESVRPARAFASVYARR
jgi:hypothetical protein